MRPRLIFTHWNKNISVGVTDGRCFYWRSPLGELHQLTREYYAGGLYYRIPRTSTRFSRRRIEAGMRASRIIYHLPEPLVLPF